MRRRGSNSSPLAAAAQLLLLLLLLVAGCFHCAAAAARHLPSPAPVQALVHQAENGVKAASAGADGAGGLVLQEGGTGNGYELSSNTLLETTTTMGAEACDEGNDKDDCVQRRLLVDAHLDYIYTQHKGKP